MPYIASCCHNFFMHLQGLYAWRDGLARKEDESTGYILPNQQLIKIGTPFKPVFLIYITRFKCGIVSIYLDPSRSIYFSYFQI